MKRLILFVILFLFPTFCIAFDDDTSLDDASWENLMRFDESTYDNKAVTDKEFKQTLDAIKNKGKKNKKSKYMPRDKDDVSHEFNVVKELNEAIQTIIIPSKVVTIDNKFIEAGYYKILHTSEKGQDYFNLFQGHKLIVKVKAERTKEDLNQFFLNFIDVVPYQQNNFKIIYGNIDLNLEGYLFSVKD